MKQKLAADIPSIWLNSEKVLEHPVSKQLYSIAERIDTVYMLLGDVLDQYKNSPQKLKPFFPTNQVDSRITAAYDKRYLSLKSRLLRLAIFSTLSVFLSNWVTFFIVEIPLANLFYEGFNLFTTIIDFVVPTAVMFALVSIIRHLPQKIYPMY